MCRIYAGTDPSLYEPVSRSLRLHGAVTSLRLEARFWALLDELAASEETTTPKLLATLYDEVLELRGEVANFASLVRVVCTIRLERQATQADGTSRSRQRDDGRAAAVSALA